MKRILGLAVGLLIFCTSSHAFRQEALNVRSEKMNKDVPVTVITPDVYGEKEAYPVIYLLHGYSDDYTGWAKEGVVGRLSDQYGIIFVMPDRGYDSWYFDSEITPEYQYETFVSSELVSYVDSHYKTMQTGKVEP